MIVKRAEVLGYCMGVRRAVDTVLKAANENANNFELYTYGPLIHNPPTMEKLKKLGVKIIDSENFTGKENYWNSIIVIRAHGISPLKKIELEKTCGQIIDATCSRVKASQSLAHKHSEDAFIILAGDKNHGELISIAGYAEGKCLIVQNAEEAASIEFPSCLKEKGRAVLIAQTTIKESEYEAIASALKKRIPNLKVFNTICPATSDRQAALKKLAHEVDAVLVIGGKNSANTKRLYQTAVNTKKPSWLIEDASEIPKEIFSYSVVGLTAGASTPDFIIDEVEKKLLDFQK
ncbi:MULTISPECIES: 4-hydroxy-3-methylbut-2-enyl diphosphate reductase [unclassified Treponema]|uniref:4-hydroxy-3-methylbut-2-enyl diphosphate reductase n=1 Tax=unclassified Treponema TaxID=2638727 RepID=UPI0020A60FCE|nr:MULTISPECIES: 4-hydroxy-3-methylbut-2-enyl diphosphate reductase [unclassified Treponema]UTC65939.1 4-hydroxy-3-methylbut-2-enyl diphosphate reductase [Treponema sp. OMZ 789]UTC68667.1 4-hydroxy-3-methylbut-2-enyl diphosphate reductase [Treponema sp. OMZ 790]UTC71397.1 4-hydroxy-3-methylbut-2-enyl diphosphate reductase [Treponema sp. OMZ 791]